MNNETIHPFQKESGFELALCDVLTQHGWKANLDDLSLQKTRPATISCLILWQKKMIRRTEESLYLTTQDAATRWWHLFGKG